MRFEVFTLFIFFGLIGIVLTDDFTRDYNETTTNEDFLIQNGSMDKKKKMPPPDFIESRISHFFWLYGQAFNMVIGVPGNTLSLMVLRRNKMTQSTSSLYLQVLSFTDLIRVIVGVPARHLVREVTGDDPTSSSWLYCVGWYYLLKMTTSYNHWIMAGVSIERCIAIMFPLKSMRMITMKNAKRYLMCSFACTALYTLHFFKTYTLVDRFGKKVCTENSEDYFSREIRVWLDYILIQIIPGIFIFLCNGFLVYTLFKRQAGVAKDTTRSAKDPLQSIVRMLVVVSLMYLLLTTPANIQYILNSAFQVVYDRRSRDAATEKMTWSIVAFAVFFNHSCNFILYIAIGTEFRREFMRMIAEKCCCCSERLSKMAYRPSAVTKTSKVSMSMTKP